MNRNSAPRVTQGRARVLLHRLYRERDEQTLLLGVGLICVVLALLFVATPATAVYLDLKTFTSLASSATAAGANNVEAHPYYGGGVTGDTPGSLTDVGAGSKVAEDLPVQSVAARLEGVTIISVRTVDSHTAEVKLQARSRPPFLPWGILPAGGFTITATGSTRMTTAQ